MRLHLAFVGIFAACVAHAQPLYREISIPVRDGQSLAADFYTSDSTVRRPTILVQTPYNKAFYRLTAGLPPGTDGAIPWDSAHYNLVIVDWRGFYASRGAAVAGYDRGLDGYDVVEWIAAQPWADGAVGTWGPSALGAIQYETARHRPPHLRCAVPLVKDFKIKYSDFYYGGQFRKEHVETLETLGLADAGFVLMHPTEDLTWLFVSRNSDIAPDIAIPMLLVTGWYDHFPDDILRAFADLRSSSPATVRSKHKLLIGPWLHEAIGQAKQGVLSYLNADSLPAQMALAFFDRYLRGIDNGFESTPAVRYYQMGEDSWRSAEAFPDPAVAVDTAELFLHQDFSLSEARYKVDDRVEIRYDPRDPSPTVGGARLAIGPGRPPSGPHDQALVEDRDDALTFSTAVLENDLPIAGAVTVLLDVSTDREDTDLGVRLCDVYPDGRSILITQGIQRLRFRNGTRPQDTIGFIPGGRATVAVRLQTLAMTWRAGHRLRIVVTGSNYPQFERNLNVGGPLYGASDTLVATTTILIGPGSRSSLLLPVPRETNGARGKSDAPEEMKLTDSSHDVVRSVACVDP